MATLLRAGLGAFAAVLLLHTAARGDVTAEQLQARSAASQAAILTLQAHVEVTIEFNVSQVPASMRNNPMTNKYSIDFVRSGSKERTKERGDQGVRDLIRDFESGKGGLLVPKQEKQTVNTGALDAAKNVYRGGLAVGAVRHAGHRAAAE
jgi:hypothetical protein